MKAFVDKDLCVGCGLCEAICPKVFKMNDIGVAEAVETELDNSTVEDIKNVQQQCPVEAITVSE